MTAVKPASPDRGMPAAPLAGPDGAPVWSYAPKPPRRHPWIAPVAVGVGGLVATLYTGINDPNTSHAFPLCPLKALTGVDCPMCGGLRAVHSLTHLDVIGAADHNIAAVILLPFLAYWYVAWLGRSFGRSLPLPRLSQRTVAGFVLVLIAFGVARNLPIPGHDFLNSTALLAGRSA